MSKASELALALEEGRYEDADTDDVIQELRRLDRVKAELVEALENCVAFIEDAHIIEAQWTWEPVKQARAALTSATKETKE